MILWHFFFYLNNDKALPDIVVSLSQHLFSIFSLPLVVRDACSAKATVASNTRYKSHSEVSKSSLKSTKETEFLSYKANREIYETFVNR
jgi:hypothetical protein